MCYVLDDNGMSCTLKHVYEIYTKHPTTGETGWDIKWVSCTEEDVVHYPDFDCIITVDDYPYGDDNNVDNFEVDHGPDR